MAAKGEKAPPNFVHQNAILCETIHKERRHQKLYTNYSINPYRKIHIIAGKPNSIHDTEDGEEDTHFRTVITRAQQEPEKKYNYPQTEAQEVGWINKPLLQQDRGDRRLSFPRQNSSITRYMNEAWKDKEQRENMN